ncbi:AMP-binding protein [Streptomyces sp. BI20]|uniref:AMP-binding protein n=1 Tax=Streptomyces sp. BI20 TaxID=3403460 RepID=UPI003C75E3CD
MPSTRLVEAVTAHGRTRGDRPALFHGRRTVTYRELVDLTEALRPAVRDAAGPAGTTVVVPAHKTPETIALLLAAFTEGLIPLVPSPDLGEDARLRLARQSRAELILTVDEDGVLTGEPVTPDPAEAEGFSIPDPEVTRILLTTSGSTGTPKIVPIGSAGFDAFGEWAADAFALTADEVSLSYAPLNFDLALLDVWALLVLGAAVVLVDKERSADAPYVQGLLTEHGVTFVQGVPMLHRNLIRDGGVFDTVRTVIFTGDALPPELLAPLAAGFPAARFHNIFGCTETNDSFGHEIDPANPPARIPIGRPLPGVRALILGPDGDPVEGPGTGELLVNTPFQTRGYLRTALNEPVFTERDGLVFYRTGDIVSRTEDGLISLEGRADWQVKVRGVRTNLQEVETVLAAHPDVVEAVIVTLPDPEAGVRLHAHVARHPEAKLTGLGLRAHAGKHLPRHAIPSSVHITDVPLPRTSTGKPDRNLIKSNRLKEIAAA